MGIPESAAGEVDHKAGIIRPFVTRLRPALGTPRKRADKILDVQVEKSKVDHPDFGGSNSLRIAKIAIPTRRTLSLRVVPTRQQVFK